MPQTPNPEHTITTTRLLLFTALLPALAATSPALDISWPMTGTVTVDSPQGTPVTAIQSVPAGNPLLLGRPAPATAVARFQPSLQSGALEFRAPHTSYVAGFWKNFRAFTVEMDVTFATVATSQTLVRASGCFEVRLVPEGSTGRLDFYGWSSPLPVVAASLGGIQAGKKYTFKARMRADGGMTLESDAGGFASAALGQEVGDFIIYPELYVGSAPPTQFIRPLDGSISRLRFIVPAFDVPKITQAHPRLFVDADELATTKELVRSAQVPHVDAWNALKGELAINSVVPKPYVETVGEAFYAAANPQAGRARDLALAWWITGDNKYADRAVDFITAWSNASPTPGINFGAESPNTGIYLVRGTLGFVYAADLLWNYPGFTKEKKTAFEQWLRLMIKKVRACKELWKANDHYNRQYFTNHHATHALGLAAMGSYLGDRELVQYAIDDPDNDRDFTDLIAGIIMKPGDLPHHREPATAPAPISGEMYDRYRHYTGPVRGLQYGHLSMNMMAQIAEVGRHLGLDLWNYRAPGGETLIHPFRFYSDFYRLGNATIKHGLYADPTGINPPPPTTNPDETPRLGLGGDTPATFELGLAQFPTSQPLIDLLRVTDRARYRCHTLGPVLLTHGVVFAQQQALSPRSSQKESALASPPRSK
jgi:hypothetical protein